MKIVLMLSLLLLAACSRSTSPATNIEAQPQGITSNHPYQGLYFGVSGQSVIRINVSSEKIGIAFYDKQPTGEIVISAFIGTYTIKNDITEVELLSQECGEKINLSLQFSGDKQSIITLKGIGSGDLSFYSEPKYKVEQLGWKLSEAKSKTCVAKNVKSSTRLPASKGSKTLNQK